MDNGALVIGLQSIHMLLATLWFGGLLWTEIVLWPRMRAGNMLAEVQGNIRSPLVRAYTAVWVIGTIISGYALGVAHGVFDDLYTPHGLYFVLAAMFGTSMIVWWSSFPPRTMKTPWRMFYTGFWVLFALMVGLRFTA